MLYAWYLKRVFDVVAATLLAVAFAPAFAILALLVRLKLGRPIVFRQPRTGQNGQSFMMFKLRTMTNERDVAGNLLDDAERLTAFGKFMRSTSLDEIPGVFNVILGDMSMVGPRPLLVRYLNRYSREQSRRHDVKPGLTGWAQVNGRNAVTWEERFDMDVWYVDRVGLVLDLRILFLTALKVIRRSDVTSPGHATMPEFWGTTSREEGRRAA
ncbi:MAG: sugar transferase [Planctomycetes bacterium]|nr:sugar transferase [Planctomycetota bacterium]